MLGGLSYQPNEYMTVKDHIFKLKILLMLVLMDECRLEFAFLPYVELLDLYLFSKGHSILRHSLEDGFLGAPVNSKLFVSLILLQIVDLVLRESLLLHY